MPEAASASRPVVPFLKIPASGDPYLEGQKCGSCGAIFLGEREHLLEVRQERRISRR